MEPMHAMEPPPDTTAPQPMTLMSRLLNVFATPGDVFDQVKRSPASTANWLVPVLICCLIGVASSVAIFSQPAIAQKIHEQQTKNLDDRVSAGKMTREQADQAAAMAEKFSGPGMLMMFGGFGALLMSFISLFWWAFLLWLLGRFCLKGEVTFTKGLEVAGLASMIAALETVLKTLLVVAMSDPIASLSAAMLLKDPNPQSATFMFASMVSPMTFWVLAVRSIGLAKLGGTRFAKAAVWVFGAWLLVAGILISLSLGLQAAFTRK